MYSNTHILIVDDNPSIREDYRRILCPSDLGHDELAEMEAVLFDEERDSHPYARPNFQTAFASQGEEAEAISKAAVEQGMPFAVAIVDVRMPPGIDGVETVKRLWKVKAETQIILCTAYSDYSWREIVEQLGASHRLVVLKKPFDPIEILQLCQAMCIKWVAEREMAYRQLDLQSRLIQTSLREEKIASELYQERSFHAEVRHKRSEAEVMDVMSGLASSIAHDFNNALTVIQGHLSLALLSPTGLSTSLPIEQMTQAVERASLMSKQMMALSSEIQSPADLHVFNALPVITQQLKTISRVLKEKVRIDLHHNVPDFFICASEALLLRMLNLMIIRAQEQTPRGSNMSLTLIRCVPLNSRKEQQQMMIQLCCYPRQEADMIGIQKEITERLIPAAQLSEGLGGTLRVGFGAEGACTLTLSLPEADPNQPKESIQCISQARIPVSSIDRQFTIMVVDDERCICDILGHILGSQGHLVFKAHSALEAWTVWQAHPDEIDIVISDIYLPDGLTGFDLAGHLRAGSPQIPIIYMSGYHPTSIPGAEPLILGVNYLVKPFDLLDLLNVVTRAIESPTAVKANPAFPENTAMLDTAVCP